MCYIKKLRYESSAPYSLESMKKNIDKLEDSALQIIKNSEIYTFHYKDEKDTDKKRYGFIIGKNYKTPKEIITQDKDGIDTYNMSSIMWKAIQEQQEQIEQLQNEIKKLKGEM